jgi:peptide chain release factor 1
MTNLPNDKLDALTKRFDSIEAALAAGPAAEAFVRLSKEYAELEPVVRTIAAYRKLERDLAAAGELRGSPDREMAEMAEAEYDELKPRLEESAQEIRLLLLPKDAADEKNVILEVRAGTGGDEAALFAGDLMRMYQRYADLQGWSFTLMDESPGEAGGYKEATAAISGRGVYAKLKYESGVHRVQRVPETEASGRIHTSAATVAVLPEVEELDIDIRPEDIRIDTMRSSGAGGQHVNKTASAVRLTHYETNIVVSCQDEKSQHKNKAKALRVLKTRLYEHKRAQEHAKRAEERKTLVGSGDRSERIRTYNFPENRVTDHRIGLTLYKLDTVLSGRVDLVSEKLIEYDRQQLRSSMGAVD